MLVWACQSQEVRDGVCERSRQSARDSEVMLGPSLSCVILNHTSRSSTLAIACQMTRSASSMLERRQPCVCDLDVLGDRPAARANATENLAVDYDRETAAQQSKARLL